MHSVQELYLHIPFCKKRCAYCDFYSSESLSNCASYISSLVKTLKKMHALISQIKTVYIGGGTPSVLGMSIEPLLAYLDTFSPLEWSIEVNPESFSFELLNFYTKHGINRISLGIQSLQDEELNILGRLTNRSESLEALHILQSSRINYSADVMLGIPHQTKESLEKTLFELFEYDPCHVSAYPLQLEKGTKLYDSVQSGKISGVDEDIQATYMTRADFLLNKAGYEHYEVANYAKNECYAKHNLGYWTQQTYLGIGPSAASQLLPEQYNFLRTHRPHLPKLKEDTILVRIQDNHIDELDERLALAEKLMLRARLMKGIPSSLIDESIALFGEENVLATLDKITERGLLRQENNCFVPTLKGWLMGNELYALLLNLA